MLTCPSPSFPYEQRHATRRPARRHIQRRAAGPDRKAYPAANGWAYGWPEMLGPKALRETHAQSKDKRPPRPWCVIWDVTCLKRQKRNTPLAVTPRPPGAAPGLRNQGTNPAIESERGLRSEYRQVTSSQCMLGPSPRLSLWCRDKILKALGIPPTNRHSVRRNTDITQEGHLRGAATTRKPQQQASMIPWVHCAMGGMPWWCW